MRARNIPFVVVLLSGSRHGSLLSVVEHFTDDNDRNLSRQIGVDERHRGVDSSRLSATFHRLGSLSVIVVFLFAHTIIFVHAKKQQGSQFAVPLLNSYEAEVALNTAPWLGALFVSVDEVLSFVSLIFPNTDVYPMDFYRNDGGRWANYNVENKARGK